MKEMTVKEKKIAKYKEQRDNLKDSMRDYQVMTIRSKAYLHQQYSKSESSRILFYKC